jgi:hypothetical protein
MSVGKRKDPPKVSSPEAKKLHKKKKEELSDPPYVPPEEEHKTRSKNKSNRKKSPEEIGLEDGVVGQVNVKLIGSWGKRAMAVAGEVIQHGRTLPYSWSVSTVSLRL